MFLDNSENLKSVTIIVTSLKKHNMFGTSWFKLVQ